MARRDAHLDHLANIALFSACSAKELGLVGRRVEEVTIKAGDDVVQEGRTGREFFVIVDGKAKVSRKRRKIAELGPGDHFGELALFEKAPRNATVTALTDLDVVVLDRREFSGLLNDVPSLAFKLAQGIARRLRESDGRAIG